MCQSASRFYDVLQCSLMFDVLRYSTMFCDVLRCSTMFCDVPISSKSVLRSFVLHSCNPALPAPAFSADASHHHPHHPHHQHHRHHQQLQPCLLQLFLQMQLLLNTKYKQTLYQFNQHQLQSNILKYNRVTNQLSTKNVGFGKM